MKPPIKLALLVLAADLVAVGVIARVNQSSLESNGAANLKKSRQFEFAIEFEKKPQHPPLWLSPSSDKISKLTSNRRSKLDDNSGSNKTQTRFRRQAQGDKQQLQPQNSPQVDQLRTTTIPAANPNFEAAFQGECNRNNNTNNPCDHICLDLHDGTYECACFYGFTLAIDGYSCTRAGNLQVSTAASPLDSSRGKVASGKSQPKSRPVQQSQDHLDQERQRDVELRTRGQAVGPEWPMVVASDTETTTTAGHHRKLADVVESLQKQGRRRRRERDQKTAPATTTSQRRRKEKSARVYRRREPGEGNGLHHSSRLVEVATPARRRTSKSESSMALGDSSSNLILDSEPDFAGLDQVLGGQRRRPRARKFTQTSKLAPRLQQEEAEEQRLELRGTEEADAHRPPLSRRRNRLARGRNPPARPSSSHGASESTTRHPVELDNDQQNEEKEALLAVENQIDPQLWMEEERRLKDGLDEQPEEDNDDKLTEELPIDGQCQDPDGDEEENGEGPESDNLMTTQLAHNNNDLGLRTASLDDPRRGGAHVNPGGSSRRRGQDGSGARLAGSLAHAAHNDWESRSDRQSSASQLSGSEHDEGELNNLVPSSAAIGHDDDDDQDGDQDTRVENQQTDLEEEAQTRQLGADLGLLANLVGKTMGDYYYRYAAAPGAQAGVGMNDDRRRLRTRLGQSQDVTAPTLAQPATTTRSPSAIKTTTKASENNEDDEEWERS